MALPKIAAVAIKAFKSKKFSAAIVKLGGFERDTKVISINDKSKKPGFLDWLKNGLGGLLAQLGGFLIWAGKAILRAFNFSLTTLVSWLQSYYYFLYTFNWNITDQTVEQQLESAKIGLASLLGGAAGELTGFIACGAVSSAILYSFNPTMAAFVLKELGEEGLQEFLGYVYSICTVSFRSGAYFAFIRLYQSNRALFHLWRDALGTGLDALVPGNLSWQQYVDQQNSTNGYLSFAGFIEESVETLSPPAAAFWEEFFDELFEGCFEALYVVAGGIERFIAEEKARKADRAQSQAVQIIPNREQPKESIILAGDTQSLRPAITQTLASAQLLENRDVGAIVGQPVTDYLAATPQSLRIVIEMMSVEQPPWTEPLDVSQRAKRVTIAIPDVDRTKCDWETIKLLVGGENGYLWGRFRATAFLSNGRQMAIYAATEVEAQQVMSRLLVLTQAELLRLSISEEKREGELAKRPALRKDPTRVYPAYFTILNRREFVEPRARDARHSLRQTYQDRRARIPLYPKSKPDWVNLAIADLIQFGVIR